MLKTTLSRVFGYETFRDGQESIIQASIEGKDSCVFWATGHGKSLCYQLPAFHLKKTVLIVSPLISLMQDQVFKANSLHGVGKIAVSLSSNDNITEDEAFNGKYLLIYVSPERAVNPYFVNKLKDFHAEKRLALIAIDEAHCIGQWGFDFRKEFQELNLFRDHATLSSVPIMALTASATNEQRSEIIRLIKLRNPVISNGSVDRPNLMLSVLEKSLYPTMIQRFKMLIDQIKKKPLDSTIIYAITRKEVESITETLQQYLTHIQSESSLKTSVAQYHAGMSASERKSIHLNFLNGRIHILVATTAFGMGIDKPDIRRIIHYGPPKTFEEYYQQIGRAGRDGLASYCQLIYSRSEFNNYKTDFYMGGLPPGARETVERSLHKLREYADDIENCRRCLIVNFFGIQSSIPIVDCNSCDNCIKKKSGEGILTRDFTKETQIILRQVFNNANQSVTTLLKIFGAYLSDPNTEKPQYMTNNIYKELLNTLVKSGYLVSKDVKLNVGKFNRVYDVYNISEKGKRQLDSCTPVILPVPATIKEYIKQENDKKLAIHADLERAGIDISLIPQCELESGKGPVLSAYLHWINTLKRYRSGTNPQVASNLEKLLSSVFDWREQTANRLHLSPVNVMPTHVCHILAYVRPLDIDAIRACGVNVVGMEQLVQLFELFGKEVNDMSSKSQDSNESIRISVPRTFQMNKPWPPVLLKKKQKGTPKWEISWNRFQNGKKESLQVIALTQENGKPIQTSTVEGHIRQAVHFQLLHGKEVDLDRLMEQSSILISTDEWEQLEDALIASNIDLNSDPVFSKDLLRPILGSEIVDDSEIKTNEKNYSIFSRWCSMARMFLDLKRAGVPIMTIVGNENNPVSKKRKLFV